MLHIIEDYYCQPNNYGYTVLRKGREKDENGQEKETSTALGYVGSLKESLELVLKDSVQRKVSGADIELGDALQYIRSQTNRILRAMEGIEA